MPFMPRALVIIGLIALYGTTGCTIKSTVKQITDTTSNVTGTTSGAAWWSEDGQLNPDFKATAFVAFNHENLRQDLAAGRGEYLTSIRHLLGVPVDQESAFFSAAQAGYGKNPAQDPAALLTGLKDTSQPFLR